MAGKVTRITITCNRAGKPTAEDIVVMNNNGVAADGAEQNNGPPVRARTSNKRADDRPNVQARKTNTVVIMGCSARMVITWKIMSGQ